MATSINNLGITFPDDTTQTTAYVPGQPVTGSELNTQDFVGTVNGGTNTYTWTKPTGNYNWVWVQLWAGGGGAKGTSRQPGGGYTSVKIPYAGVSPTVAISIPPNAGSGNGGGGTGVSAPAFHPYCSATWPGATGGAPATDQTLRQYQYLSPASVVSTINEGSTNAQSGSTYSLLNGGGNPGGGANGANPGGGAFPNNGNGGTYGGYARILVKTFWQDPI